MSKFIYGSILAAVTAVATLSIARADREDQWVFRMETGDGRYVPTAIFLSWDFSAVVLLVECDVATHDLVMTYRFDPTFILSPSDRVLSIEGDNGSVALATSVTEGLMIGRVPAGPALFRALEGTGELLIYAPNEMEEPWYVGQAGPLKRVAKICGERD